jgi:hypothetical protein
VKLCDKRGEYNLATGSAHAFSSKSGRCQVGFNLIDGNSIDVERKPQI